MTVLNIPTPKIMPGSDDFECGREVKKYQSVTRANRGPDVIAMKSMKTDRSGYLSPIVAETEGNHSSG